MNGWVTQRNFGFSASTRSSTNLLLPLLAGALISLLWKTLFLLQTVAILATGEAPVETPGENPGETPGETESTASTESTSTGMWLKLEQNPPKKIVLPQPHPFLSLANEALTYAPAFFTETQAALSLSVSTSPELDVAVGELRDGKS